MNDAQATALGEAERTDGNILLAIVECRPGDTADDIGVGVGLVIEGKLVQGHSISHLLRPLRRVRQAPLSAMSFKLSENISGGRY